MNQQLQQQINALEKRQNDLKMAMAKSDAHASKCVKTGKVFSSEYPEEAAAYQVANDEYNANEQTLDALYAQRAQEEANGDSFEPVEE